MDNIETANAIINILIALIIGGFIIILIEIGNRKNREYDKYCNFMQPFMKRLSAYCRLVSKCANSILYSKQPSENEIEFRNLVNMISKEGEKLIICGGNYSIDYFSPQELEQFALEINNVWYWHDRIKSPLKIDQRHIKFKQDTIEKELAIINPVYLSHIYDDTLIAEISGDFYTDIYQSLEDEMAYYYQKQHLYNIHTKIIFTAIVIIVLLLILLLLIDWYYLPFIAIFVAILMLFIGLLFICIDENKQIECIQKIKRQIKFAKNN